MNGFFSKSFVCHRSFGSILDLKTYFVETLATPALLVDDFYVTQNGRKVDESEEASLGTIYRFHPRLLGGKGGFGSMLRALGAQIEKTTNREACRDLSGRRMRDVNNEKKLKEWDENAAERERQKKEKEEENKKNKTKDPKYFFDSTKYDQQKQKIQADSEDAMKEGLKDLKRKAEKKDIDPSIAKRLFGSDFDDYDSDDEDSDDDDAPQLAKKRKLESGEEDKSSSDDGSVTEDTSSPDHIDGNSHDDKSRDDDVTSKEAASSSSSQ